MNTFKDIAYQILLEENRPLHSNEITKIALERGLLKTSGKTPEATMNAQIVTDIKNKSDGSRFVKHAPSTFFINKDSSLLIENNVTIKQKKTESIPSKQRERSIEVISSAVKVKKYATVKEMPAYYPVLSYGAFRHMIHENRNGIKECMVRIGKRLLIDLEKFQIWMDKHSIKN